MTKYTVLSAEFTMLAEENTLHLAKRSFYEAIKAFPTTNFILIDNKLENYVVYRDGKVVAGRKWKEFVKSSYNVAKPKALATVDPRAAHIAAFDKWVADNDIKAGDQVKVVRACKSGENGWEDVWDCSMDSFVGEVCTFTNLATMLPGEIQLESPKGYRYYFPHFVLEVVPAIKRVCKDVIAQINSELLLCQTGITINIRGNEIYDLSNEEMKDVSAKEFLADKKCSVCAVGGLAVSWIRRFNKFSVAQIVGMATHITESLPPELVELFGKKLLAEIEIAFERRANDWNRKKATNERRMQLINRYYHIFSPSERLIAIMQDIIDDKF